MQPLQKSSGPVTIVSMVRESDPSLRPSSNEMNSLLEIGNTTTGEKGYHKKLHVKIVSTKQHVHKQVAT